MIGGMFWSSVVDDLRFFSASAWREWCMRCVILTTFLYMFIEVDDDFASCGTTIPLVNKANVSGNLQPNVPNARVPE